MEIDREREAELWGAADEAQGDEKKWLDVRGELAVLYQPVVWSIAHAMSKKLPRLATTCQDDLVSMGQVGLLNALDKFDRTKNVRFTSFCGQRVRGAIIDELRQLDHVKRRIRDEAKKTGEELPQMLIQSELPDSADTDSADDDRNSAIRENPDLVLRYFSSQLRPIARMLLIDRMSLADVERRCLCPPKIYLARMKKFWLRLEQVAEVDEPMKKRFRSSFIEACRGLAQEDSLC